MNAYKNNLYRIQYLFVILLTISRKYVHVPQMSFKYVSKILYIRIFYYFCVELTFMGMLPLYRFPYMLISRMSQGTKAKIHLEIWHSSKFSFLKSNLQQSTDSPETMFFLLFPCNCKETTQPRFLTAFPTLKMKILSIST